MQEVEKISSCSHQFLWDSLSLIYRRFFCSSFRTKSTFRHFLMVTDLKKVGEFLAAPGMVFCTFPKVERINKSSRGRVSCGKKSPKAEGDLPAVGEIFGSTVVLLTISKDETWELYVYHNFRSTGVFFLTWLAGFKFHSWPFWSAV